MMRFGTITAAASELTDFLIDCGAGLPDLTREALRDANVQPSKVDTLILSMEALYAGRESVTDVGKALVADIAAFAVASGWQAALAQNRGDGIRAAMLRELGAAPPEGSVWPEPEDDPFPDPRYVPPQ